MKQIDFVNAYKISEELVQNSQLTVNGKWILYQLRRELKPHYDFYLNESKSLFGKYKTTRTEDAINFETPEMLQDYLSKQEEIDNLDAGNILKEHLKLSDVPGITVPQIEQLDKFIEFVPE